MAWQVGELTPAQTELFWSKVAKTDGCWLWLASKKPAGYGQLRMKVGDQKSRLMYAHRIAWSLQNGAIPDGMMIDHMCRIRTCVRPDHLRCVTPRTNATENSDSMSAKCLRREECGNGHMYDEKNTYLGGGFRQCRRCKANNAYKHLYGVKRL